MQKYSASIRLHHLPSHLSTASHSNPLGHSKQSFGDHYTLGSRTPTTHTSYIMSDSEETKANIVAVKLPAFFKSNPKRWFTQAEAQFAIAGIKQEKTKYFHILKGLDEHITDEVSEWTDELPDEDPYTNLKAALIKKYTPSETARARSFFDFQPLGDGQPSDVMTRLIRLGPNASESHEFLYKNAFLLQMPPQLRQAMASVEYDSPRQFGEAADALWQAASGTTPGLSASTTSSEVQAAQKISKPPSATSASPHEPSTSEDTLCWYHRKHGNKARKCADLQSCSWSKNGPAGSRN